MRVTVEHVPWAQSGSRFTSPFENQVAYLAQKCDQTTVTKLMRVAWRSVGRIVRDVVHGQRAAGPDRLDGLSIIGIDELHVGKRSGFITLITDHQRGRIVWGGPGKSSKAVKAFFEELGPERSKGITHVTLDMSAAYIKGVREAVPDAKIVFDRFHVQRLVHDAVDEVRRELVRVAEEADEKTAIKGTRTPLQKNPWNLSRFEKDKLSALKHSNSPLYRAYLLKETMLAILDRRQINVARSKLKEWLSWAARSRLEPLKKLAGTIRKHTDGILEYVRTGLSNGRVEGFNGKARTITRRAFGLASTSSLIAMLFLCCGGIHLQPSHVSLMGIH